MLLRALISRRRRHVSGAVPGAAMKRVAAAVGEGSSVIQSVHQYLTRFPDGQPAGDGPIEPRERFIVTETPEFR
jgi:hypothetical protein